MSTQPRLWVVPRGRVRWPTVPAATLLLVLSALLAAPARAQTAPTVTNMAVTSTPQLTSTTYGAYEQIEITLTFSAAVNVAGTPHLVFSLGTGNPSAEADYTSGSGTTQLVFTYTVLPTDEDTNGIFLLEGTQDNALVLDGGAITATADNTAASLSFGGRGRQDNHKVDGGQSIFPTISTVAVTSTPTLPSSGTALDTYGRDARIALTVTFDRAVTVTGTVQATLEVGDDSHQADYASGSGTSSLIAAIARAVADDGRTATVVDLDPVSGRLPGLLGAAPPDGLSTLLAAMGPDAAGEDEAGVPPDQIDRLCAQADGGVSVIGHAHGTAPPPAPSADAVRTLLAHLANRTHLVLVAGFPDPDMKLEIMQCADARVLIYEPTLASLSVAVRSLALLGTGCPATLVQCFSRTPRSSLSSAHVRYALGDRQPDVVIPFDTALHAAATGEKSRRPGRAYRQSVRKAMEHAIESAALSAAEAS